jgi:hypothetical protein
LSQSPSAAEIAKEVIDRLPRTTGTNLPNIEKTAGASHQYPTRSPSDADREILVVDNINTYIVENIVPAENTASHMVQNWLLGINPETRQGYIKSLNEQAKKFGDVYSGIAIPLKGHDVYCGLDLCSIVQSINLGTNNTTSEQLRRIAETLSSLGESINWKAIKEKNDSGLGGTDLTIEAINRGIFYPWAEKDMNPRGLVDDVLKTLSQRRNELAEQATKK